jgi:hypothetical protein
MNRFTAIALGTLTTVAAGGAADDTKTAEPATSAELQAQMAAFEKAGTPRAEHAQLAYFAGNWTARTQVWMDPEAAATESTGTCKGEVVYGGRYVSMTCAGTFLGQPFDGYGLLGYDNLRGKFFNTWVDSTTTGFWLAWGEYDKASNAWTFLAEMPDRMKPSASVKVRQVLRIYGPNHYGLDRYEFRDGKETRTMNIDYRRQ